MTDLIPQLKQTLPPIVEDAGEDVSSRVIEFFTAEIRNQNTREAYGRAARRFFRWAARKGLDLSDIEPPHVAAYVEEDDRARATIKLNLAAIRRLFDFLVSGGVLPSNPAAPVKGPKMTSREGKTPVLTAEETRELLDSIVGPSDEDDVGRLRDRALIGVMTYSFARVSAACRLDVEDYFRVGHRRKLRLKEKSGKERAIPVHHKLEEYLSSYIEAAEIGGAGEAPLFQSLTGPAGRLTGRRLLRENALEMVKRRAEDAGFDSAEVNCHTFRGTGITTYLENGGALETAQYIAGHASVTTTKLYDRRQKNVEQEEIERIRI